jgi:hypothetical protein
MLGEIVSHSAWSLAGPGHPRATSSTIITAKPNIKLTVARSTLPYPLHELVFSGMLNGISTSVRRSSDNVATERAWTSRMVVQCTASSGGWHLDFIDVKWPHVRRRSAGAAGCIELCRSPNDFQDYLIWQRTAMTIQTALESGPTQEFVGKKFKLPLTAETHKIKYPLPCGITIIFLGWETDEVITKIGLCPAGIDVSGRALWPGTGFRA